MKIKLFEKGFLLALALTITACVGSDPNMEQAKLDRKNGDLEKALTSIDKAIETNYGNAEAHLFKGETYSELAQRESNPANRVSYYEGVLKSYTTAQSIYDTTGKKPVSELINGRLQNLWAHEFNEGAQIYNSENPTSDSLQLAIAHFVNAIAIQPDSIITYRVLADTYFSENNYDKAIEYLSKTLSLGDQPIVDIYQRLAYYYSASGNEEEAINVLKKAQAVYPENIEVVQGLANAYLQLNDTDNALATVKTLIDADPENAQYHKVYGTQLYTTAETVSTEYETNLEREGVLNKDIKASKNKKQTAELKAELATLQSSNKTLRARYDALTDEALDHLKEADRLSPDNAETNYIIGVIIQNRGALILIERDNTDDNKKAAELDNKAKETLKASLPYYEKATEIAPEEKDYWMNLFRVYTNLGMMEKAQTAREKAGL